MDALFFVCFSGEGIWDSGGIPHKIAGINTAIQFVGIYLVPDKVCGSVVEELQTALEYYGCHVASLLKRADVYIRIPAFFAK